MNLTVDQIRFLEILADGKKKTYVHVVKGFGMPLTPMAPTFTNKLARPLRKAGLVKQTIGGGYKITDKGRAALDAAKQ
jgi:hypothetical protein